MNTLNLFFISGMNKAPHPQLRTKGIKMTFQRKLSLILLAYSLIPLIVVAVISRQGTLTLYRAFMNASSSQIFFYMIIALLTFFILFVAVWLGSRFLTKTLHEITTAVERLAQGDFSVRIDQRNGDERGKLSQAFNNMVPKLEHHMQLQNALNLAMEVQQNLLPKSIPKIEGLDIAAKSIYCYEIGGDYYDFLNIKPDQRKIDVVVGDVCGHGISSALLMASVRASIKQRSSSLGSISDVVSSANRQLALDVGDSGRFVTFFYLAIDALNRKIRWVCAGHEPTFLYDPTTDSFEKLAGSGLPLGIDKNFRYEENTKIGLKKGQIIFLFTDGIPDARNANGDMLGKNNIKYIIRQMSNSSAEEILSAVIQAQRDFQSEQDPEDDSTLVVIKMLA